MQQGLIVLEGIDACGKTTQAALLAGKIKAAGHEVVLTREPFLDLPVLGSVIAGAGIIRDHHAHGDTLDSLKKYKLAPETDAFLFAADRSEHVSKVIKPVLAEGKIVVTDRYYPSSIAYQSTFDGLDAEWIRSMNRFAPEPDLVVFLKVSLEEASLRRNGSRRLERFEKGGKEECIQSAYEELAKAPNWVTIDADGSVDDVAQRVWDAVEAGLKTL
ncbi:dTMP kinase [Candidatus Micrarchaeota archaeon CG1_02_55_22]|nr:MAG: dTMP kinase [Candidatus Micrarchaeota archaeon CG1_02_55_22]